MTVRYNIIIYLIGEGFKNILKNKKSTASSLTIMCMVMLVFGAFFIIGENINYIMNNVEEAQAVQVFFENDVTDEEAQEIGEKINKIDKRIDRINRNIHIIAKKNNMKIKRINQHRI